MNDDVRACANRKSSHTQQNDCRLFVAAGAKLRHEHRERRRISGAVEAFALLPFFDVMHLLKPPVTLFAPAVAVKIFRSMLRTREPLKPKPEVIQAQKAVAESR